MKTFTIFLACSARSESDLAPESVYAKFCAGFATQLVSAANKNLMESRGLSVDGFIVTKVEPVTPDERQ